MAPFYAYGVINDNVNSDGSFRLSGDAQVRWREYVVQTLPVGHGEHPNFSTELILTNFSDARPKLVDIHFVADAIGTPNQDGATVTGDLIPPGGQAMYSRRRAS